MHSNTLSSNPIPTNNSHHDHDHDHDHDQDLDSTSSLNSSENPHDHEQIEPGEIVLDDEPDSGVPDNNNNPPESFWVSHKNVTDWLNHHTFIERKTSVKMVPSSRNFEPGQTRTSQRSVSFNNNIKPQATIIGFRKKPGHSSDGKPKQNDRQDYLRLFKNRSVPGKGSGGAVTEPRSPRVSCMGRVGSMRGRARRTGFWKKVKAALLNRVRTNKGGPKNK